MSDSIARFPAEPSIYPYSAVRVLPASSLLVFAPHPDDEIFGCGGVLALALDAGTPVHIVVVTDGGQGGDPVRREQESRVAAQVLAAGAAGAHIEFWRQPDRTVLPNAQLVERMSAAMAASQADWVLAPSPFEIHPDHRAVCLAACMAAHRAFSSSLAAEPQARLAFYEVGHPLPPNLLVDITPVLARKSAAMACFESQLHVQRYDQHVLGLNRFRSYTLGPGVTHAEALHVVGAAELADGVAGIVGRIHNQVVERLGLAPD